ncbi:alpha/beta hydrolase [Actinoplanes sp. NPDC023936]|uniref:alpha/beta hydrolase n=1 Tax=Actinoplanes sp. NPDC023936 TaxID=3154910 RepID=UPI003411EA3E
MRRLWAAATTAALCATGATVTAAPAEASSGGRNAAAITWGPCTEATLKAQNAECGFVAVPMDHAKPDGAKIQLAVSRVRHTVPQEKYQGVILVNPGGPGGAGRSMATLGTHVPNGGGAGYDWIGFDPRGVGASTPKLVCDTGYAGYNRPAYVPVTKAIEKAWHARTKAYAAACAKAGGPLLEHLRTEDSVRDIEALRVALGADKINFYGFSYGTYLGQVYATKFPDRVRRMVLDGVVDPGRVWYRSNLDQDIAFDRAIKVYFAWIAKYDAIYHLGRTGKAVERLYYRQLGEAATRPIGGVIGPAELTDVFLQPGYYIFGWEATARAFSAWVHRRDPKPLRKLYDDNHPQTADGDNSYAIYLAVQCTDSKWPSDWRRWAKDNWRVHKKAPFETWGNAWYNAPCRHWAARPGRPVDVTGTRIPPVLMISETLDAATPFTGAIEARRRFPQSVLVEGVGGTTHAGSLFGNACVDSTIGDYLASGVLPKRLEGNRSDKECAPIAQPTPTAAVGRKVKERLSLMRYASGREGE